MYVVIVNIFLVLWALHSFGKMRLGTNWVQKKLEQKMRDLKDYMWPSIGIGFLSSSFRSDFVRQSWLWRTQIWDMRRFLFSSLQSVFSFFWVFMTFVLFLEVSGYAMVLLAVIMLAISRIRWIQSLSMAKVLPSLMYFSLALLFLELSFKNSTILMQYLMESEAVFFLTIDSVMNLSILLLVSIVISYFLPVQGWSLVVTFLLFLNSQISFMAFAFVIVGELAGMSLYLLRTVLQWDPYYKKRVKGILYWALAYCGVALLGIVGFRYLFTFGETFNQLMDLKWIFLGTVFVLLGGFYATLMTWGHFASAVQDRDVIITDAVLVIETQNSGTDLLWCYLKDELRARREKLIEYRKELEIEPESRKKIPPFVLTQFEQEIKIIEKLV